MPLEKDAIAHYSNKPNHQLVFFNSINKSVAVEMNHKDPILMEG